MSSESMKQMELDSERKRGEQQKIKEALASNGVTVCVACRQPLHGAYVEGVHGGAHPEVTDTHSDTQPDGRVFTVTGKRGGNVIEVVQVMCDKCGYIMHFTPSRIPGLIWQWLIQGI